MSDLKVRLQDIANKLVEVSKGRVRLAFQEKDRSPDPEGEASHFIKIDEQRAGRDIPLWAFMAEFAGNPAVLSEFAGVVCACEKVIAEEHGNDGRVFDSEITPMLIQLGDDFLENEPRSLWRDIWSNDGEDKK